MKANICCIVSPLKWLAFHCEVADIRLNKVLFCFSWSGKKMSPKKIIFYIRISFQGCYFNVEGRKITKLEKALFSKQRISQRWHTSKTAYVLEVSRLLEVKLHKSQKFSVCSANMSNVGYWPNVQNARQDQDGGFVIICHKTSTSCKNCVALGTSKRFKI